MFKPATAAVTGLTFGLGYLFSGFTQVLQATSPVVPIALVLCAVLNWRAICQFHEGELESEIAARRRRRIAR